MLYFCAMSPLVDHFIPNRDAPGFHLLGSFLQTPPASVAEKYVDACTTPGDLLIDPFACQPTLAQLALKMERRAILFESNPLWAWVAHALATVPEAMTINAAFARLGDALKDDTPLRSHIAQLYVTRCSMCNVLTPVDYFIHQRDEGPIHRHYTCANCGETRDEAAVPDDIERFKSFDAKGMHYHLAFERVAPAENPEGDLGRGANRIRNLLDLYTPRSLYALVTLTIKGDTLFRSPPEQQFFNLLMLHLLDRGTSLYASAAEPAQLKRHKQFIEFNLWHQAEIAVHELSQRESIPLADSPRMVAEVQAPSVWLGRAGMRRIAEEMPKAPGSAALVLAALPSRRAAIGALSYFWGAWTLKRPAVQSLLPFLDPQTSDPVWERRWYVESLAATMTALARILRRDAHAIFIFDESNYQTIEALLLAAAGANLDLQNLIFQPTLGDTPRREFDGIRASYRITFSPSSASGGAFGAGTGELKKQIQSAAIEAGREILTHRGEPLAFPWLHHAAYARAARAGLLHAAMRVEMRATPGQFVFQAVQDGLTEGYAHDLDHYAGLWFHSIGDVPLIDRVEEAVRNILGAGENSRQELEDKIYARFPGDLTPEEGLIDLCARAAARESSPASDSFGNAGAMVEKSLVEKLLGELGERLGYDVARNINPFDWVWQEQGEITHGYVWRERAAFADLARIQTAPTRGYLIVPESQIELLCEKVRRLPPTVDAFREAGWDFVRVSSLQKLLETEQLERSDLVLMPGLVPMVAEPSAQLELL